MDSRTEKIFLGKARHNLKNPINAILGYSEMLIEDCEDLNLDSMVLDLEKIHKSGKNILKIIENRLKTKAKKKYIKLQKGDVEKTFASTDKIKKLTGFKSKVNIKDGIYHFIDWYKKYYNV